MTAAEERTDKAAKLGLAAGQVVQERGYDDDCDQELREGIEAITGTDLVDEGHDDTVDVVLVWFRDADGDLADALMKAEGSLEDGGPIWLLVPETGRNGYIEPSDINEAAVTVGLSQTKATNVAPGWSGTRFLAPKR